MDEALKYPVGRFKNPSNISTKQIEFWISEIEKFPKSLREITLSLSSYKLDLPYREGGWNGRQVVHHIADSHMNSLIRFKLALTEENPMIKPYYEDRWAHLPDYEGSLDLALNLVDSIHAKWVFLLKNMNERDFSKTFQHPETNRQWTLAETTALYAWHGQHHLGHLSIIHDLS